MARHVRSISLPSRPNPQILNVDENLRRQSSTEATTSSSSLCNKIRVLRDVYDSVEGFLQLPHTGQILIQKNNTSCVDELLNASVCFLDVCGTSKDVLTQIKEHTQELQSTMRRKRGVDFELIKEGEKYLASRRMSKKLIKKSLSNLKNNFSLTSFDTKSDTELNVLRQVQEATSTLFESLLSFITGPKAQSKASSWSLVSKLMHSNSKRVHCEEEESEMGEFQNADSIIHAFIGKYTNIDKADAHEKLRKLEMSIQDLEEELDSLLRRIIRSRGFLLNIFTQ